MAACECSLRRLKTDYLDLYLLHWRGSVPLAETLQGFQDLRKVGKIRACGVSNFDTRHMEEIVDLPGGGAVVTDQVLYNLARRGIEWGLLLLCRRRGIPIMAYSPVEQGRLLDRPELRAVAERCGAAPAQVALTWLLRQDGLVVIPKAGDPGHVRENRGAVDLHLTDRDLRELDQTFPPPQGPVPLAML